MIWGVASKTHRRRHGRRGVANNDTAFNEVALVRET